MNTIFQRNDKVFDFQHGEGLIKTTDGVIVIDFGGSIYTFDYPTANLRLSFTPYDLINGGFSQDRPKPEIEKGELLYCRNNKGFWQMGYFLQYGELKDCVFITPNPNEGFINAFAYDEYSLENPLI